MNDFMLLQEENFKEMNGLINNREYKVNKIQVRKLIKIQEWYRSLQNPNYEDWYNISIEKIMNIVNLESVNLETPTKSTRTSSEQFLSPGGNSTSSVKMEFAKTVKRNISDYPKLKNDLYFANWNRTFKAIAISHGMDEILDYEYSPPSEEQEMFTQKQKFMYSIFVTTLMTTKSKRHVRVHERTQNAQLLYFDLCTDFTKGTCGDVAIEALEKEITNMVLHTTWNKPIEEFLNDWEHKILDLENLRDKTIHDRDKRKWLTASIRLHPELYDAVTNAQTIEHTMRNIHGSAKLDWDQFYQLIRSKAVIIDSNKPPKAARQIRHQNIQNNNNNSNNQQSYNNNNNRNHNNNNNNRNNNNNNNNGRNQQN